MYLMALTEKFADLRTMMMHFTLLMLSAVMLATTPHNKKNKNNYLCRKYAASQQNIQASLMLCIRFAVSLQKIRGISAKHPSKLDVLHSICCIFAEKKREQTIPQVRGENNLITKKWKEIKVIYWSKELS